MKPEHDQGLKPAFRVDGWKPGVGIGMLALILSSMLPASAALAQTMRDLPGWATSSSKAQPDTKSGTITLIALLAKDSKPVSHGLIWRIYEPGLNGAKFLQSSRQATPALTLDPGRYIVNVAYGLAYLTQIIEISAGTQAQEQFILNAGGLRVRAELSDGTSAPPGSVSYDIHSDERDQNGNRVRILSNAQPNTIVRLNSGIYQLTSTMGDANARVSAEVTVEAGKLTEATFAHDAGKCTFKLARQPGGEALTDVKWVVVGANGNVVKESAGALPTHILAPGAYKVNARWNGKSYTRSFALRNGDNIEVEVVMP